MPEVHPSAIIEGDVRLADDVVIGPGCILTGPMTIGPGTRLVGHVHLQGPLTLGRDNTVYPFACLGFAPQHGRYDPAEPGRGLVVGDGNVFREQVTIHRAFGDDGPTLVGDHNVFMTCSHAGHDCRIGSHCTFTSGALLAGHVVIEDGVILGGNASVHQFCRIGRGVMISGHAGVSMDVPPWFMVTGVNLCGSVNIIGLRRSGMPREQIDEVRWVYRTLYREARTVTQALEALRQRDASPVVAEYVRFIETSERGICSARGLTIRGMDEDTQFPAPEQAAPRPPGRPQPH